MEHEAEQKTNGIVPGKPSSKPQTKRIWQERVICKIELLNALREVKEKRKRALICEKRARARDARADKLAKKAELAAQEAIKYKQVAEKAWHEVMAVQELAEAKRNQMKTITGKLRRAEQKTRQVKNSAVMKQNPVNTSV